MDKTPQNGKDHQAELDVRDAEILALKAEIEFIEAFVVGLKSKDFSILLQKLQCHGVEIGWERAQIVTCLKEVEDLKMQIESFQRNAGAKETKGAEGMSKCLTIMGRENIRLREQIQDLAMQVRALLSEIEKQRGHQESVETPIASDRATLQSPGQRAVTEHLVTFDNIEALQVQNQRLLAVTRDLIERQESASGSEIPAFSQNSDVNDEPRDIDVFALEGNCAIDDDREIQENANKFLEGDSDAEKNKREELEVAKEKNMLLEKELEKWNRREKEWLREREALRETISGLQKDKMIMDFFLNESPRETLLSSQQPGCNNAFNRHQLGEKPNKICGLPNEAKNDSVTPRSQPFATSPASNGKPQEDELCDPWIQMIWSAVNQKDSPTNEAQALKSLVTSTSEVVNCPTSSQQQRKTAHYGLPTIQNDYEPEAKKSKVEEAKEEVDEGKCEGDRLQGSPENYEAMAEQFHEYFCKSVTMLKNVIQHF